MAIIAINEQLGSRGADLGGRTARELGYRLITSADLIAAGAGTYKVTAEQLKITDERQPYFWERLKTDVGRLDAYFRAMLLREMAADRVVVVGRLLAFMMPHPCGLRVRAAAPIADRVRRTALDEKLEQAAAERRVRDCDREIRARAQHLFAADIDDPAHYTLVFNTSAMPPESAAAALAACALESDRHRTDALAGIRDAAIAAQVRAALAFHPKIGGAQVRVRCAGGAVQVSGAGLVPPWDELVRQAARPIEGIASIEVTVEEPPIPPHSG